MGNRFGSMKRHTEGKAADDYSLSYFDLKEKLNDFSVKKNDQKICNFLKDKLVGMRKMRRKKGLSQSKRSMNMSITNMMNCASLYS